MNTRSGLECSLRSEDVRIRLEAHAGAAPVRRAAGLLQLAFRLPALESHAVQLLLARHFDFHAFGQRVRDRNADAVQAARRLVDLRVEFAAGVQRAHDDFQRGLAFELRMGIDRNTAAIVGHADEAVRLHLDFNPIGVAGQGLVHGVVDDFGKQVMQRLFVRPADIHSRPTADRLKPLQHLDMFGGVTGFRA